MLYDARAFAFTHRVCDSFGPGSTQKMMLGLNADDVRRIRAAMNSHSRRGEGGLPRTWDGFFLALGGGSHWGDRDWWRAWLRALDARGVC